MIGLRELGDIYRTCCAKCTLIAALEYTEVGGGVANLSTKRGGEVLYTPMSYLILKYHLFRFTLLKLLALGHKTICNGFGWLHRYT